MPDYYFDTHDGRQRIRGDVPLTFASLQEVGDAALRALSEMAREGDVGDGRRVVSVEARDGRGQSVFRASLCLVVEWPQAGS